MEEEEEYSHRLVAKAAWERSRQGEEDENQHRKDAGLCTTHYYIDLLLQQTIDWYLVVHM